MIRSVASVKNQYCPFYFIIFLSKTICFSGLSHTPRSEKSEIAYTKSDESTFKKYTEAMMSFLEKYDIERQADQMQFEDCGGKYNIYIHTDPWLACNNQDLSLIFMYLDLLTIF